MYRTAYLLMRNSQDAEDVVQSVFLTLIEKHISFDDPEHEKAWLIVATRNKCKDILRSRWRRSVDLTEEDTWYVSAGEGPDDAVEIASDVIQELLMQLPEDQREILLLHYYEGYTVKETAEMLNIKESTVRSGIASAKRALNRSKRR